MNVIYTDVLVIGGGLAGLRMAVAAKRRGHAIAICRSVTRRLKAPHFARRLAKLTGEKEPQR